MKKLLTIITISALTVSTLVGCGKTNEKSDNTNEPTVVAEQPTETVEVTAEPTEKVEITETPDTKNTPDGSEENPESGEVDLPGYLTEYPLISGNNKVYIKVPEGYTTFSDKMNLWDKSYDDVYNYNNNLIYLFPDNMTEFRMTSNTTYYSYSIISENEEYSGKWFIDNKDIGIADQGIKSFIVNTETLDNGIVVYSVQYVFDNFTSDPSYFMEATIDDFIIQITVSTEDMIAAYKTMSDPFIIK